MVREVQSNFRGQVEPRFPAQNARDGDELLRLLSDPGGDIPVAPLAYHTVGLPGVRAEECHAGSIGEDKAKVIHNSS
jgi:hypothetical protein